MKQIAIALAALALAASTYAQGVVNFSTRVGTASTPVTYEQTGLPVDNNFMGQLYASAPGGTLTAVGAPTPFRSDAGKGYITAGGNVTIPGVTPGSSAQIVLRAWKTEAGSTYEAALATGGGYGESAPITVPVGGGTLPPGALTGLTGFVVKAVVPEPGIAALGLLGAGLLLVRRKK